MLSYFYFIAETKQIRWDLNHGVGLEPGQNPDWDLKVQSFCYVVKIFYLPVLFVCIMSCFGTGELHCIMQDLFISGLGLSSCVVWA